MTAVAPASRRRAQVRVKGTVQGVGFRPFAYRLARELLLGGFVLNDSCGVKLEIEGSGDAVAQFLNRLEREAPPLAVLERVTIEERPPIGENSFTIARSPEGGVPDAPVT